MRQPSTVGVAEVALVSAVRPDGGDLLDDVETFIRRFVALPNEHSVVAATLWAAHTHVVDAFEHTPRIAFLSPEPASGKTRALEIVGLLVPNPLHAVNVSPAYLFRKVADTANRPSILFDEIDTVFGPRAGPHEDVRAMLNAGHARGAVAGRCVVRGKVIETEELPAFCAVAFAGLGGLPDTILTRAVVIRMRRRAADEAIQPYRRRQHASEGQHLRGRLSAWLENTEEALEAAWPELPDGVEDRAADVWEPLIAIADMAGGSWPERARAAAEDFVLRSAEHRPSLGVQLLLDVRGIFLEAGSTSVSTENLLGELRDLQESPWNSLRGEPLRARDLARLLANYEIRAKTIRQGARTLRGYDRRDFEDAWHRYLPGVPPSV